METTIIDIIDKKAARQYRSMTEVKKKAYRAMLYAGAQITLNKCTVRDIAPEIGYSESGTSKLVLKWIELMEKGDLTVNLIMSAIQKLPKSKRFQHKMFVASKEEEQTPILSEQEKEKALKSVKINKTKEKPMVKNVLGFLITPEEERRARAAIRSSIIFFQTFGKGRQPRVNGEYYTPGTNPSESVVDNSKWLPSDTAALYCGCKEETLSYAAQNGAIERRVYRRNANRNYYEYKVEDLDRFIKANHLY